MRTVSTKIDAKTNQLHIGNRWIGHKGLDLYDNTARMHDPLFARLPQFFALARTAPRTGFHLAGARQSCPTIAKNFDELVDTRFHTVDPLWSDYPNQSPWSHCAANSLNVIDPDGCEWRQKKDVNGYTLEYEWVEGKDARDEKGNLLPGVYEVAILFTAEGKNGKKFDPNNKFNIGSSQAIVYGKGGPEDIHTFDACTYPSNIKIYATVPEGDYEAKKATHKGYPALRVGDIGTTNFYNNEIELGYVNPNPNNITGSTKASFINIHKPGQYNKTGMTSDGKPISMGCLLIDLTRWNEFINLFPKNILIGVTIQR